MDDVIRIAHADLVAWIRRVLEGAGVPPQVRKVEAEIMAEADLYGVPSHGVRMLPLLLRGLREGVVRPDPKLEVVRERAATCVIDADYGPGRFVSCRAMHQAVERAGKFGIGACLATRTNHWGRAHAYARRAALEGKIGLCTTNAIPNMCAWGSSRPLLGNNPLAIGVPAGVGREPVVLDIAMSQAAVGKVATYLRERRKVPHGWGLDAAGQPTEEPAEILASRKVLPLGGHKGVGLAVMMELLTGALAGLLLSHEVAEADRTGGDSGTTKLFVALDPDAFVQPEVFLRKQEQLIGWIQSQADPQIEILFPGARGEEHRRRCLIEGIPIHAEIVAGLVELGVPFPPSLERRA